MAKTGYNTKELVGRYPCLECCQESIDAAFEVLKACYKAGGKLLVCGNGGSAADSEHIVGELMKGFKNPRLLTEEEKKILMGIDAEKGAILASYLQKGLPAVSLVGHPGLSTAFLNDVKEGAPLSFAQQVYGLGTEGDVLLGISTSGNSENVIYATIAAKAKGMKTIALTGAKESKLSALADVTIRVPEQETYRVQELHLPIYHCLCLMLEDEFFGGSSL